MTEYVPDFTGIFLLLGTNLACSAGFFSSACLLNYYDMICRFRT
jgi:hypothetical protein